MTRYLQLSALIFVATLVSVTMALAPAQAQNVFTVDAIGDGSDANAGDGTCATSGGDCTFRAAIEETNALSNASGGPDEIHFDISGSGPHTIQPQSPLPEVADPVVIDGGTEPDFSGDPVVQLDGSALSLSEVGLQLETGSGGSEILNLSLTNIPAGLAIFIRTDQNLVDGCWVGLAPDGTVAADAGYGIRVFGSNNQIGDPNGQGNVVVEASTAGIDLSNSSGPGNQAQNNLIGETPSGTAAGNARGITIALGTGGIGNTVGGTGSNESNRIVHNNQGVVVDGSDVTDNEIRGNQISDNDNLGIDLADDGVTTNDEGDGDDGPNRLQNFPELPNAEYDPQADEVTVTYQVPSDPNESGSGASAYPLTVDFYRTGDAQEEGEAYLGTDTYTESDYNTSTSGPDPKTVTFTPAVSVTESDHVVATATDANGNTSEFIAQSQQLPVELVGLDAAASESSVRLSWQTASEKNNAGFEVQRQSDEDDGWKQVGYVESKAQGGSTTEATSYQYTVEDLPVGTHTFRLKQVNLDGSSTSTSPVSVKIRMQEAVKLTAPAPNPVSTSAATSFAVKEQAKTTIMLYNTLGQRVTTVYNGTPPAGEQQSARIDVTDLPSGTYFLRLEAGGETAAERITVVR